MWAEESVMYQIYPLGMCGAPFENDGKQSHRILKVLDWIPHLQKLGITAVYFGPLFESDTHGYNTRDYRKVDVRLGTEEDLVKVCDALHGAGIRILFDGVFNHAGRGFFAFQDVLEKRENSAYKNWFYLNFQGNSCYNDGLWYEGWEGHYDLVKLKLDEPAVSDYLLESVRYWIDRFGIDGLRLDVAYMVDRNFLRRLREETDKAKEDFWLIGEILGGDYRQIVQPGLLHSCTNYECYKGLYSSFNSMNLFEISHSLMRQFGQDPWTLYRGLHLMNFADNHDVSRIASILSNEKHLPLLYAFLMAMPGYPCIYYGSEWGVKARKEEGDPALRAAFDKPEWNSLTDWIAHIAHIRRGERAFAYGEYRSVFLTNRQCVFERRDGDERILVGVNADENPFFASFDAGCGGACDLIGEQETVFRGGAELPPYSVFYWKVRNS